MSRGEQEAMVEQWRKYAYKIAWTYVRSSARWMTAVEGLFHAAQRFQPAKGASFSTYATFWVRQTIQRTRRQAMGVPCHLVPDTPEFDACIKVSKPLSLNYDKFDDSSAWIGNVTGPADDPDKPQFDGDFWDRVNKYLQPRLQEIIRLRFREGMTLEEAGQVLGITRERVRQLEAKALDTIERRVDFGDVLDQFTFTEHALV